MSSWARTSEKVLTQTVRRAQAQEISSPVSRVSRLFGYSRQNFTSATTNTLWNKTRATRYWAVSSGNAWKMPRLGTRKLKYRMAFKGWAIAGTSSLIYCAATGCSSSRCGVTPKQLIPSTGSKIQQFDPAEKCYRAQWVWVSDITYIKTDEGYNYLSLVTDKFSRKIVGYDLSETWKQKSIRALQMAIEQGESQPGLIHHSDRGLQYCSYSTNRYYATIKSNPAWLNNTIHMKMLWPREWTGY